MADKVITQRAQGYGSTPVTVTVQIDGVTVLQGAVPTVDQPPPALPDFWTPELGVNAWSWTVDASFNGAQTMTVSVDNGQLYICDTFYTLSDQPGNVYSFDFIQEQGDFSYSDPFTNVTVNGTATDRVRDQDRSGQWVWQLSAGDQFACSVNIKPLPSPGGYIRFDSIPVTVQSGSSGTFMATIPSVNPDSPLPGTYGWRVLNETTTDADFQNSTGSVTFVTPSASFDITTVTHDAPESSKTFRAQIYEFSTGKTITTSDLVTIT
jgi:hypothetical protein